MGGFINTLTSPFGVRLFPGGPYSDAGMGDKQLEAAGKFEPYAQQAFERGNQYNQMAQPFFRQALSGTRLGVNDRLPDVSELGALGRLPGVIGNIASAAGVSNPFGEPEVQRDPYRLEGFQQQAANRVFDRINQGRQGAISSLRSRFAAHGITDPRAMAAAEAAIHSQHDQMIGDEQAREQQQAFQTRLNTMEQFPSILSGLYGAQQGRDNALFQRGMSQAGLGMDLANLGLRASGQGGEFLGAPVSAYGQAAQRAQAESERAGSSLGSLLGLFSGQMGFSNPFAMRATSPTPDEIWGMLGGRGGGSTPVVGGGANWWDAGSTLPWNEGFPAPLYGSQNPFLY